MNKNIQQLALGSIFALACTLNLNAQVVSQKVGTNPTIITPSTAFEVESTNKGVLLPRVALTSATDATTISSPATSLLIYNTATAGTAPNDVTPGYYYWNGTVWTRFSTGTIAINEPWFNTATNTGATANTQDVYQMGSVGIGTNTNSYQKFSVVSDPGKNLSFLKLGAADNRSIFQNINTNIDGTSIISAQVTGNGGSSSNSVVYNLGLSGKINWNMVALNSDDSFHIGTSGGFGIEQNDVVTLLPNGKVGIGTSTPGARLEVNNGTTAGAIKIVDGTQGAGKVLTSDANGLATWQAASAADPAWALTGNAGTTAGTNFIGTTDAVDFVTKTNNIERIRVTSAGNVGIGNSAPATDAVLELSSANKSLLLTRVATTGAIANPVNGMVVYDILSNCIKAYENGAWSPCLSAGSSTPTNSAAVTCDPPIVAGVISHNQPYGCLNYDPGAFISSLGSPGLGGTINYTWQQSTDGGNSWSLASGTNNTQNYDPPALTSSIKYRRSVTNSCGVAYSNIISISIAGVSSPIQLSPCAINQGGIVNCSIELFTGSTVTWSVSPNTGLTFNNANSVAPILTSSASTPAGLYTVSATIVNPTCGTNVITKTINILPTSVSLSNLKKSCKEIFDAGLSVGNGLYWVDPDGTDNAYCAEQVYCNMTENGGGWTLVLKSMNNNSDFHYSSTSWTTGNSFNANDFNISASSTANSLYNSYNFCKSNEVWVDFVSSPDLVPFMLPLMNQTPKEMATGTPNTLIGNQYLNQPCTNSGIPSTYYTPGNAYSWQAGAIGNGCNISSAYEQIRFGVVSNNENNEIFNTFDTALGIGIGGTRGTYGSGLVAYAFSVPCSSLIGTNGNGFYKALLWVR